MNDDGDGEFLTLVANRPTTKPEVSGRTDEAVALGNVYATAKGQRSAETLEYRRRDGSSFAMPYAYLPICWWQPPDTLLVEYPGFFTVALRGRNLDELHTRLCDRRVTWIRECDEAAAASLLAAVTSITILNSYPSREAGSGEEPSR